LVHTYPDTNGDAITYDTGYISIISSSAIILPFETNLFCYFHMYHVGSTDQNVSSSFKITVHSASNTTYDSFESVGTSSLIYGFASPILTTTPKQATPGFVTVDTTNYAGQLVRILVQSRHYNFGDGGVAGQTKIKHVVLNTGRPIVQQAVTTAVPADGAPPDIPPDA
jgi:hypothetical protein